MMELKLPFFKNKLFRPISCIGNNTGYWSEKYNLQADILLIFESSWATHNVQF